MSYMNYESAIMSTVDIRIEGPGFEPEAAIEARENKKLKIISPLTIWFESFTTHFRKMHSRYYVQYIIYAITYQSLSLNTK